MLGLVAAGCGGSGGGGHDGGPGAAGAAGHLAGSAGADGGGGAAGGGTDGGGDTSSACVTGGSGTLVVAVQGLPASATMPMIRVAGGGLAMPMMLSVGTPATVPAGGGYKIQYRRVKIAPEGGGIVGKAFQATSSFDGCVKSGTMTTATLTYTQEPGSEHLWIGVSDAPTLGNEIAGFASADIAATASKNPMVWKTKHFVGRPGAGAFDSLGNFWVPGGDVVNMYPMMTLAVSGDPGAPTVVLTQPAASPAVFAAFDSDGNLWVTRGAPANTIVRYTPDDQMASGSPVPAVVISSPDLNNPAGLAFDKFGDLWVACEGNDKVVKFGVAHLAASYAGAADIVLTAKTAPTAPVGATYTAPNGVAFDQAGNLWVGYISNLVAFSPAQQAATALVAGPLAALNVSAGTGGFAFDESGGLWCAGSMPNTFNRYPKAVLGTTGDVTPDIVITSSELGYAETLVLDPSPTWSTLQDWL
jgi:sugar lactone lactonase YvrE